VHNIRYIYYCIDYIIKSLLVRSYQVISDIEDNKANDEDNAAFAYCSQSTSTADEWGEAAVSDHPLVRYPSTRQECRHRCLATRIRRRGLLHGNLEDEPDGLLDTPHLLTSFT
jgi:hypothetical protein